jgi:hypothetical protein
MEMVRTGAGVAAVAADGRGAAPEVSVATPTGGVRFGARWEAVPLAALLTSDRAGILRVPAARTATR